MLAKVTFVAIAAAALAACDSKEGTSISINTGDADGNVVAAVDGKTGQVSINVPGFSGNLKLPKIKLDAGDFDLNGVHLYPGSTISGMNVDARDTNGAERVRISFDSPATPGTVRDWFLEKLSKEAGFKVQAQGSGIAGTTDDNKPFRMELAPNGSDKAKGTIVLGN